MKNKFSLWIPQLHMNNSIAIEIFTAALVCVKDIKSALPPQQGKHLLLW